MTIWFAVLTHNRPRSLLALLRSIDEQERPTGCDHRIVILDNASIEENRQEFLASAHSGARHIVYRFSPQNLYMVGKYALEDMVLAEADPARDFYVHVDDDVVLEPGWLIAALQGTMAHGFDACGSVEMRQGEMMLSGQSEVRLRTLLAGGKSMRVWDWRWEPAGEAAVKEVAFAGHRALLIRMACVQRVRHSQELLIGGEDLDYSLALRKAGYRMGIVRSAAIQHRARAEQEIPGFRTRERVTASWRHFYRKWGFVRLDACSEAGLSPHEWLRIFAGDECNSQDYNLTFNETVS